MAGVVAAFTRAIRAMGYYDASHPVFEQSKREAYGTLREAWRLEPVITLGCAGRRLVIDEAGTSLGDGPSTTLARRLFDSSVVAIRLHDVARPDDVGVLMKVLAESPEKIRSAGGVATLLEAERVQGIDVLEVDFGALFAGSDADLSPLVGGDPIAEIALKGVLRFKEGDDDKSDALAVSLEKLTTPESLGEFLDDLLEDAEPEALADGSSGAGPDWGHMSGDDVADFAAQAYLTNQEHLTSAGKMEELAASAQMLSNALVRLSPDARFSLLRRLAGGDTVESAGHEQAVRQLGEHLEDDDIVDAVAQALLDRSSDSDTVRAIGNLIRRIRPVEAERKRLMERVDATMLQRNKPIDGVLWQQIQAQALEERALGLLEMSLEKVRPNLVRAAQRRLRGKARAVVGQDVLFAFDALAVSRRAARAYGVVVLDPKAKVQDGTLDAVRRLIGRLVEQGDEPECLLLLGALVRRVDKDPDPTLNAFVEELLSGDRGSAWSAKLLARGGVDGRMMGELILNALDGPGDREYKEGLLDRLARFDPSSLLRMGEQAARAEPLRVHHLVRAALRADAWVGVKVARVALKNPSSKAKELAIKALVDAPSADALGVLAHAAGWKGDKYSLAMLGLKSSEQARAHKLQMAAIGALGLSRAPGAVRPLVDLLMQKRLFESKESEEVRLGAAQALLTNGTPEAKEALEEGAQHKKKVVRDVCTRVLANRRRKETGR